MSSFEEYKAQVAEWERKYGKPEGGPFRWNPAETKVCCAKCGKVKKKMSRHHIASDFLFALLAPDLYARRYLEFRKEDVAKLCNTCHRDCERYYDPIQERMLRELRSVEILDGFNAQEWCEHWRGIFRDAYKKWLERKSRTNGKRKRRRKRKSRT